MVNDELERNGLIFKLLKSETMKKNCIKKAQVSFDADFVENKKMENIFIGLPTNLGELLNYKENFISGIVDDLHPGQYRISIVFEKLDVNDTTTKT